MALTKKTITDKIETVAVLDHFVIQVRERNAIMEAGTEISSSFLRYVLEPNHDVSKITDETVKAQFQAVMTETVKKNFQLFMEAKESERNPD